MLLEESKKEEELKNKKKNDKTNATYETITHKQRRIATEKAAWNCQ